MGVERDVTHLDQRRPTRLLVIIIIVIIIIIVSHCSRLYVYVQPCG